MKAFSRFLAAFALAAIALLLGAPDARAQAPIKPYDPLPAFSLTTTDGEIALGAGMAPDESYVLLFTSPNSAYGRILWDGSLAKLFSESPRDVNYVFGWYGAADDSASPLPAQQARVEAEIAALPAAEAAHWREHVHFVVGDPMAQAPELAELLAAWGGVAAGLSAEWVDAEGATQTIATSGPTDSGWARSLLDSGPITAPLGWYGFACNGEAPAQEVAERIALIERGTCTFTEKATNAADKGAVAALLFSDDRPKGAMGGDCGANCPEIPVAMIDRGPGLAMRDALAAGLVVTATLSPTAIGAEALAIDHQGRVREFGTIPWPWNSSLGTDAVDPLHSVALEAEYIHYEQALDQRLAAEADALVIPMYEGVWAADPGWRKDMQYVDVTLPDAAELAAYDTLELDVRMSCGADDKKSQCPPWDYLVYLYLCEPGATTPQGCPTEFARWITAYWSGGRWVTDLTPMLGLIKEGGTQRFAFWTVQRYRLDIDVRLTNRDVGLVPRAAVPLLQGGAFWNDYNARYHPMSFDRPAWAERVELVTTITGHGFGKDEANCAEFCNHTHHFRINDGPEHVRDFPTSESLFGCLNRVADGVVPNQGGTWIYGRSGWCPGLDVPPWRVDITAETEVGVENVLTYRGLYQGEDYVPVKPAANDPNEGFDARVDMESWLVYYAAPGAETGPVRAPYPIVPGMVYIPVADNGAP